MRRGDESQISHPGFELRPGREKQEKCQYGNTRDRSNTACNDAGVYSSYVLQVRSAEETVKGGRRGGRRDARQTDRKKKSTQVFGKGRRSSAAMILHNSRVLPNKKKEHQYIRSNLSRSQNEPFGGVFKWAIEARSFLRQQKTERILPSYSQDGQKKR